MEFFNEELFASGILHLYAEKPTVIVLEWEKTGIFDIGEYPILGRMYQNKQSDFPFLEKFFQTEVEITEHFDLLFSYLQILKNIQTLAIIQVGKESLQLLETTFDTEILEKYNLIFLSDLHKNLWLTEGLEQDATLLNTIRHHHHEPMPMWDFPLIATMMALIGDAKYNIINEQYINTWILGLNKDSVQGYCCVNIQLL